MNKSEATVWLVCAIALAYAIVRLGLTQLGALDDNIPIDVAWRIFAGQRPYIDFYLPLDPLFYVGAGGAFRLWGVNWMALVLASAAFAVLTFAVQTFALRQFMPGRLAIFVAAICEIMAMLPMSVWWYDANASIAACTLLALSFAIVINPGSIPLAVGFSLTLAVVAVSKVNFAALSIMATLPALFTLKALRKRLLVCVTASALLAIAFLAFNHLNPVDVFRAYFRMAGVRGIPSVRYFFVGKPNESYISLPLIAGAIAAYAVSLRQLLEKRRANPPREFAQVVVISSAGVALGLIMILMSTEHSLITGIPILLVAISSLIAWGWRERLIAQETPHALTSAVVLSALASVVGVVLYARFPFETLIEPAVFRWPNDALLAAWGLAALMSVLAVAAPVIETRGGTRVAARRVDLLILSTVGIIAASVIFYFADRALAARTTHVITRYAALIAGWVLMTSVALTIAAGAQGLGRPWLLPARFVPRTWAAVLILLASAGGIAGGYIGAARLRIRAVGPERFYTAGPLAYSRLPFFRGFAVSPGLVTVIDEIESVLDRYGARTPDSNVFFGRRLEFAYAAFAIQSPRRMPVWWDPEAAYPPAEVAVFARQFAAHRFRICVLYGSNTRYLPEAIVRELVQNYRQVPYGQLTVFVRTAGRQATDVTAAGTPLEGTRTSPPPSR